MTDTMPLIDAMIAYEAGCPQRIQHFLKVRSFALLIAHKERVDDATLEILEAASLVHDIGIRPSLEKHGSAAGPLQEAEGPPVAIPLLRRCGYGDAVVSRVAYLIAHHHTYTAIDGPDYQILVEADFLVNFLEGEYAQEAMTKALQRVFRTESGISIAKAMYSL